MNTGGIDCALAQIPWAGPQALPQALEALEALEEARREDREPSRRPPGVDHPPRVAVMVRAFVLPDVMQRRHLEIHGEHWFIALNVLVRSGQSSNVFSAFELRLKRCSPCVPVIRQVADLIEDHAPEHDVVLRVGVQNHVEDFGLAQLRDLRETCFRTFRAVP